MLVSAQIADFPAVDQVLAWCQSGQVPILLGRTNFFMEFNVCFYRSQLVFEIIPKGTTLDRPTVG